MNDRRLQEGQPLLLGEPSTEPTDLLARLAQRCVADGRLRAAYRAQLYIARAGEVPHLAVGLVFEAGVDVDEAIQGIALALDGTRSGQVDFFPIDLNDPGPVGAYMLQSTTPFFTAERD